MRKFIAVIDNKATGIVLNEGCLYKNKRYGKNSPNSRYIEGGLYPINIGATPIYDNEIEKLEYTDTVLDISVTREYHVVSIPIEIKMQERYERLERIFNDKAIGLKKLAIDKPYMTDFETINNQYLVYEEMYKNAKNGAYDVAMNEEIILANETAKAELAELTLLINSIRAVIEGAIILNHSSVDTLLNTADIITMTKEYLTAEKIIEIKTLFGL